MRKMDIAEAAASLPKLVEDMDDSGEVVLTSNGRDVARIVSIKPQQRLRLGLLAGKVKVPDNYDEPLPDDVLALFEGRG